MPEYISQETLKQALTDKFKSRIGASRVPTWNDAFDAVTNIPSAADVVERKTASWIEDGYNAGHLVCSKCGSEKPIAVESGRLASFEIKYCYFCGAKMDGGQDDA